MTAYAVDFTDLGNKHNIHADLDAPDTATLARQVRAYCACTLHAGVCEVMVVIGCDGHGTARLSGTSQSAPVARFTVTPARPAQVTQWPGFDEKDAA